MVIGIKFKKLLKGDDDFGATRYDLEKMRTSTSFKKFLFEKIREDEFDDMTQIGCADYVWEYYQEWDS